MLLKHQFVLVATRLRSFQTRTGNTNKSTRSIRSKNLRNPKGSLLVKWFSLHDGMHNRMFLTGGRKEKLINELLLKHKFVLTSLHFRHFQKYIVKSNTALNPTNSNAESNPKGSICLQTSNKKLEKKLETGLYLSTNCF